MSQWRVCQQGLFSVAVWLLAGVCIAEPAPSDDHSGSVACGSCHQQQFQLWQTSHHAQAMQFATENSVLGNFSDVTFEYAGKTSRFYRKGSEYWVQTEGEDGKPADYHISYTFGYKPLQQYVIAFPQGHYQVLSIAWDSRPKKEGGQRWFHLYPNETITHDDPLHWTGPYHKWNSRCAECHSTDLQKNYQPETDSYDTRWAEINVGCEACHGPGKRHIQWAKGGGSAEDNGLSVHLLKQDQWQFLGKSAATKHTLRPADQREVEVCASCHSRRTALEPTTAGSNYLDSHSPELLLPPLYHADGQIRDEVYVAGSFWQSRMFHAGVVCSNCHEPHSGQLRDQGNGVCLQCHRASRFDTPEHHHHAVESSGALCANCHMPQHTYMVVDPRRDHSIRVPDPWLSAEMNTPNACNLCHVDKGAHWSITALTEWGVPEPAARRYSRLLAIANQRGEGAVSAMRLLAGNMGVPAIVRATALSQMNPQRQADLGLLKKALADDHSLIRLGAARAFTNATVPLRQEALWPLLNDSVRAVRLETAFHLSAVPGNPLDKKQRAEYQVAHDEYLQAQRQIADFGGSWLKLAKLQLNQGDYAAAEASYKHALQLEPNLVPAMLNLADLYRQLGRDSEARPWLQHALKVAPDTAAPQFAYGLLLVRRKQYEQALPYLRRAAQRGPESPYYSYVFAVALQSAARYAEALAVTQAALARHPGDRQLVELHNWLLEQYLAPK